MSRRCLAAFAVETRESSVHAEMQYGLACFEAFAITATEPCHPGGSGVTGSPQSGHWTLSTDSPGRSTPCWPQYSHTHRAI